MRSPSAESAKPADAAPASTSEDADAEPTSTTTILPPPLGALPSDHGALPATFTAGASAAAMLSQIANDPSSGVNTTLRPRKPSDTSSLSIQASPSSEYQSATDEATGERVPQEEDSTTPLATADGGVGAGGEEQEQEGEPTPLDYSRTGIVHLGPVGDTHRGRTPSVSASHSDSTDSQNYARPSASRAESSASAREEDGSGSSGEPSESRDEEGSAASGSGSAEELVVTQRFEFITDENGNHVIVGREGQLTRCEDEPIRTPGAVQGYGVLIAVDEDFETGNLVVRQVSENSTEILGLSPRYLFSLECFTDSLPENTVDAFWDNVQFLAAPEVSNTNGIADNDDAIHVFMLNGMGEPGSARPDDVEIGPDNRRLWHCWCAAHRPQPVTTSTGSGPAVSSDVSGMIILEFELERDLRNPLYPPPSMNEYPSGTGSPASLDASTGGSASDSANGTGTSDSMTGTDSAPSLHTTLSGNTLVSAGSTPSEIAGNSVVGTPSSPSADTAGTGGSASGSGSAPRSVTQRTDSREASSRMTAVSSGLVGDDDWQPTPEHIFESTTNRAKPLPALQRLRQMSRLAAGASGGSTPSTQTSSSASGASSRRRGNPRRAPGGGGVGMMDVFAVMSQINEQLGEAHDLEVFLKVVVGIIKDLTQFHRVLVYQFDEAWNGQVVAELVDWHRTHDLYMGLHFPASDIPAQARELYAINKVRMLYDRELPTARLVVRSQADLDPPLNMTHCYLRAMSPIHQKYLANMGVRASMSISIMAFGTLWGLIACHSYGSKGMRVSFPVRQMLRVLSQSISRNIERLSYAQRLHTRKLINTVTSDAHPGGYIVSNADDLLGLFDADYGMLVIGEGAKILGPNTHGQEILTVAEYLRLKQFNQMQVSQAVTVDYPDLKLSTGLEVIAGLLYVPLSSGGKDFIAFLRKGQPREVHWAGKPYKQNNGESAILEPRVSFKSWTQMVAGRSRAWTDEQLETAGVLSLVYGKFIEVWRQKETALQSKKLTSLLLSNASHEVRTPLNHIINYLELALNGSLDGETRDNLQRSHSASKSLLFTINDLLDLTRLESGGEISFNEPFDLQKAVADAAQLYKNEAGRRNLEFILDVSSCPQWVIGDSKKIQTVVANLTGNALKYTEQGTISVECRSFDEPHGLRDSGGVAVEIIVSDTGCGISSAKLESIFREFEQVESSQEAQREGGNSGVGLGLAVVAHIVEQLGGQLRVDSKVGEGSRFSFLIPFALPDTDDLSRSPNSSLVRSRPGSTNSSARSNRSEIDDFVQALSGSHMKTPSHNSQERLAAPPPPIAHRPPYADGRQPSGGYFEVVDSPVPVRGVKIDESALDEAIGKVRTPGVGRAPQQRQPEPPPMPSSSQVVSPVPRDHVSSPVRPKIKRSNSGIPLRILIVEDDDVNRMLLAKRLTLKGHEVVSTTNGQECVEKIKVDRGFDCILMDVQMPILNGFEATVKIREMERGGKLLDDEASERESHRLNGRIPIFVVSASLREEQRSDMKSMGLDGWVLKPINFKRLVALLSGISNRSERTKNLYRPNGDWEQGGWLVEAPNNSSSSTVQGTTDTGVSDGGEESRTTDS